MTWLRDRSVSAHEVGEIFGITEGNVRQTIWRYAPSRKITVIPPFLSEPLANPGRIYEPVPALLRRMLGVREHEDSVILDREGKRRLSDIEDRVEELGCQFWSGVRYAAGLRRFTELLPQVGYSAHHRRIRLLARIRQIICETHLHSGRAASAINEGLASIHLYRIAFQQLERQSAWKTDLEGLGRTARLVAQAYLLRREPDMARHYLDIHQQASEGAGLPPRPEYFHQLATAAFQIGEDDSVPDNLATAANRLRDIKDDGKPRAEHEIRDIGQRALYLVRGDWYGSAELLDYALKHYPADDIHISLNVAWTAACGLSKDDSQIANQAIGLLDRYRESAAGYGRQVSMFRLLKLTPRLPKVLRRDWVRHSLYANAFADK